MFLMLMFSFILMAPQVWAFGAEQQGKDLQITYAEPTTNADGTPLLDLGGTVIKWSVDGIAQTDIDIPATTVTGGGQITHLQPVPFKPNAQVTVDLVVHAYDLSGNVSEDALSSVQIDWLPPGKVK
jgi:hypothetical protein